MKKFTILFLIIISFSILTANELILVEIDKATKSKHSFKNPNITVNHYNDDFIIATKTNNVRFDFTKLTDQPWQRGISYFILWKKADSKSYVNKIDKIATILHTDVNFLIAAVPDKNINQLFPDVHSGVVKINNIKAKLPKNNPLLNIRVLEEDPEVTEMLNQVNETNLETTVQHLEDYGTREWDSSESVEAQDWLKEQYESFGLETEIVDIPNGSANSSDNVIAVLPGTLYPDEYVMIGGHYDSTSNGSQAPGADDNASGTASVLEAARIMSGYEFDRTLVFCAFSGEEYGLYGSAAYVQTFTEDMNVLAYFNIDMAGYLHDGNEILTHIIAPSSADPLVNFYTEVSELYLPNFIIEEGNLTGGDSDHTSFNNAGIMGIFPFEDTNNYSPHIHTENDLIGPSVNSFEMMATFTKASLASAAVMANLLLPPQNLNAIPGDSQVELNWDEMQEIDQYNIYRNDSEEPITSTQEPSYIDSDVENGTEYTYHITAIYSDSGEESESSNEVSVVPMPPLAFPYENNFENNLPYWTLEDNWETTDSQAHDGSFSLTDSPAGNYENDVNSSAILRNFSLENIDDAEISYWTKYSIETDWDYAYLEITTDGQNWDQLAVYTGNQNSWTEESYSLEDYSNEQFVQVRIRFTSDGYIDDDGIYIDDFSISGTQVSTNDDIEVFNYNLKNYPNPFTINSERNSGNMLSFSIEKSQNVTVNVFNVKGQKIRSILDDKLNKGRHEINWSGKNNKNENVASGIYYYKVQIGKKTLVKKCLLIK